MNCGRWWVLPWHLRTCLSVASIIFPPLWLTLSSSLLLVHLLLHNCSPVLLFLSFGLHTRPNMTLSESTWQPPALFILLMTWATCHLRSSVDFSLYSIMSVFRKFWSLKPIQSRFSDQDIVFSSAYSFLELPQVYTSNCVAKTTKMYFLTALESWIHLRPPHLACRWPFLLLPVIFFNQFSFVFTVA